MNAKKTITAIAVATVCILSIGTATAQDVKKNRIQVSTGIPGAENSTMTLGVSYERILGEWNTFYLGAGFGAASSTITNDKSTYYEYLYEYHSGAQAFAKGHIVLGIFDCAAMIGIQNAGEAYNNIKQPRRTIDVSELVPFLGVEASVWFTKNFGAFAALVSQKKELGTLSFGLSIGF